jgi:hypothetical protein
MRQVLLRIFLPVVLSCFLVSPGTARPYSYSPSDKHKPNSAYTEPLSITAPDNVSVNADMYSNVATNVALGSPVTTGEVVSLTNNAPDYYPVGVTTVTWTVADVSGNTATASQTVTVYDKEKPYIARLGSISVANTPGTCWATVSLRVPYAYDNSGAPTVTNDAPAFFPVGVTRVTWTATDMYGNWDTTVQKITVIDNELPKITISSTSLQVNTDPGVCGAVVDLGSPVVSDNCGIASITNNAPAVFPVGTTTVKWSVKDLNNYIVTATQTVTVTDNEAPSVTAPANMSVSNDPGQKHATVNIGSPAVSDNCGVASTSNDAPATFSLGTTIVNWTVTDVNGHVSTATQSVTVKDTEAPVLSTVPGNCTVSCENIPAAPVATATDNADPSPVVTFTETSTKGANSSQSSYYNYTLTRTWTATDNNGNQTTAKQVITVNDVTAPVLTVPANIVAGNDLNVCGAIINYNVSASDNSGSQLTITYSNASGTLFATGSRVVTVTAKDVSGNATTKTFTVTVNDTQKPTVKAPANVTVTTTNNNGTSNVTLGSPATSDNCSVKNITNNAPSQYPIGTTTVTWTVKDNTGNTATATQTVTVNKKKGNADNLSRSSVSAEEHMPSLEVTVAPNPSTSYFTLIIKSNSSSPVSVKVADASGRVIEAKTGIAPGSRVQVGHSYIGGNYFAEMTQGTQRKVVQLVKIK